jgi:hypothetical protein
MMQGKLFIGRTVASILPVLAVVALTTVASAETPSTDKGKDIIITAPAEMGKDAGSHASTGGPAKAMSGELSKETERPMGAPEGDGLLDMKHLVVPDRFDFEEARESDKKSEVSF